VDTLFGGSNKFGKLPYTIYHTNFTDNRDIRQVLYLMRCKLHRT
jgi:hypothetical protein